MSRLIRPTLQPENGKPSSDAAGSEAPSPGDAGRLVQGLRKRDPIAIAELFDRYSRSIHRVLVRIVGSDDPESSDLLHDTFLRAVQHVHRLRNPDALKSWLHRIAVFTAQEWLRKRKRMGYPREPAAESAESGRTAVSASPEAREAVRALYRALDTLPADERVAFVLRFIERMELTEIAETCGVSFSTVRRRIKRAEGRFRKALAQEPALADRLKEEGWKVVR